MRGKNGRVGGHDQECTPRRSLHVAAETENETRDKIYDARGERMVHVLQVNDYRNSLTVVLTDGGGIPKVSRTHHCDLDTVAHGSPATRGFTVAPTLTVVLGRVPVLADHGVIIMLDETEPSRALRCTTLTSVDTSRFMVARQARPWLMTETAANHTAPDSNDGSRPQHINTPGRPSACSNRQPGSGSPERTDSIRSRNRCRRGHRRRGVRVQPSETRFREEGSAACPPWQYSTRS
jgi:hypothetical protein